MTRSPYSARDYLPSHVVREMDQRDERQRRLRIATFLPKLDIHGQVPTRDYMVSGTLTPLYKTRLTNSAEKWITARFDVTDTGIGSGAPQHQSPSVTTGCRIMVLVPAVMLSRHHPARSPLHHVTLDLSPDAVTYTDYTTATTVTTTKRIVMRRHA